MKTLTKQEFLRNEQFYANEIKSGKIFIYPTDTIYGIGCDATNSQAVKQIREIKQRDSSPFSVIAPSKLWISQNCELSNESSLDKLPGPYTLILNLKNKNAIAKETNNGMKTLGVRIPNNWFAEFLARQNLTFITTSVNLSGQQHLTNPSELKEEIANQVDYLINDGKLEGKPSQIIDLTQNQEKIIRDN